MIHILIFSFAIYLGVGLYWAAVFRRVWVDAISSVLAKTPDERLTPRVLVAITLAILIGGIGDVLCWPYVEWAIRRWERDKQDGWLQRKAGNGCPECTTKLELSIGPGRFKRYRGEDGYEIPEDLFFWRCPKCNAEWLSVAQTQALSEAFEAQRQERHPRA